MKTKLMDHGLMNHGLQIRVALSNTLQRALQIRNDPKGRNPRSLIPFPISKIVKLSLGPL